MRNRAIVVAALLFLATLPQSVQGQKPVNHQVFKARGTNANTFLDGVSVNGIGSAAFLDVFQNPQTGDTSLLLRVITNPERGSNSTVHWLFGTIPSADFVIASDLTSATLNTTINTAPGQFDNADIGPIVDFVINLTWSPNASGHRVVTSRFFSRIPGNIGYSEVFHQNGPTAFGPMAGTFGTVAIDWFGELNANRSTFIVREFLKP